MSNIFCFTLFIYNIVANRIILFFLSGVIFARVSLQHLSWNGCRPVLSTWTRMQCIFLVWRVTITVQIVFSPAHAVLIIWPSSGRAWTPIVFHWNTEGMLPRFFFHVITSTIIINFFNNNNKNKRSVRP